jgi:hypothetical protein
VRRRVGSALRSVGPCVKFMFSVDMFSKSRKLLRLIGVIGATVIATLVVVPMVVRAQYRLPHHDLARHDPIPLRLRYNWNGEMPAAKVKPGPPDDRQVVEPLQPTAFSAPATRAAHLHVNDERVPAFPLDRTPLLLRGPPATFLS